MKNEDFFWHLVIDSNDEYFEGYLNLIKRFSNSEQANLDLESKRWDDLIAKGADPEEAGHQLGDQAYRLEEMQQLMYSSFVVSLFIFMEARLVDLCNFIQKSNKQTFGVHDLSGMGVGRAIKYLEKVLSCSFPVDPKVRSDFNVAWKLRNALVHNEGIIHPDNQKIIQDFIKAKSKILSFDSHNKIMITLDYLDSLFVLNKSLCNEISDKWGTKNSDAQSLRLNS